MEEFKTTRREFTKLLVGGAGIQLSGFALPASAQPAGQRIVVPLDGEWSIDDGVEPESIPTSFGHTVPVPGLVHSANPVFPEVDQYETREHILALIRYGKYPPSEDPAFWAEPLRNATTSGIGKVFARRRKSRWPF